MNTFNNTIVYNYENENEWTEWRRQFCFWPIRSIYGKWLIGFQNKRSCRDELRTWGPGGGYVQVCMYANDKELFRFKLVDHKDYDELILRDE